MIDGFHHIQLAMPTGGEDDAIAFYFGVLGITNVAKPDHLRVRGGCWFEDEGVRIHLGVEEDFKPASKAHPAFEVSDLNELRRHLVANDVVVYDDEPLPGYERFYGLDPFGNRLEFLAPSD